MDKLLLDRVKPYLQPDEIPEISFLLVYQTQFPDINSEFTYQGSIVFTNHGFCFLDDFGFFDHHKYAEIIDIKNHRAFPAARIEVLLASETSVSIRPVNNLSTNSILAEFRNRCGKG